MKESTLKKIARLQALANKAIDAKERAEKALDDLKASKAWAEIIAEEPHWNDLDLGDLMC